MDVDTDQDTTINNKNSAEDSPPHDEDEKSALGSVSPAQQQQQQQQNSLQSQQPVGPRHAPTYSVVNAVLEKKEDGPGPRCGHTLTAVAAVGEEGSPGYIGPRLILFGGATALEGNSGGGTPTSAGSAGISMFWFVMI